MTAKPTGHRADPRVASAEPAPGAPGADPELSKALMAQLAAVTGGLAPEAYANAWAEWYMGVANTPPKQNELVQSAVAKALDTWGFALKAAGGGALAPTGDGKSADPRYADPAWSQWPFNVMARSYLNVADWWQHALEGVPGVSPKTEQTVRLMGSNALETFSPANYLATNPQLLETTRAEGGQNLIRGYQHWLEDLERVLKREPAGKGGERAFVVGKDVAVTPGRVVLRNELIELIQYAPATEQVHAEPILIVPAWIMKYYILDLSPANSLVRYLVSQGFTVFALSWKNPTPADAGLGMDDYLRLGVYAALDAVARIVPNAPIHAVGYCIGGTLLSIAAAQLAARGDRRLGTMTTLAGQVDFSEAGELSVFITPSQLQMLDAMMARAGVLSSDQMGGAFALLRARDLVWAPAINNYVLGKRERQNDLMAWNADGTRMPSTMHSEYLRSLYLDNALARGEYISEGTRVDLSRISVPMFVVGTETDHVAPWRSVYKMRGLTRSADYTFLLTSGGHNAGIVSGPAHPRRRYRLRTWHNSTEALAPQTWLAETAPVAGSWWPAWAQWLADHSPAPRRAPPTGGAGDGPASLGPAPGQYVHG